MTTKLTTDHVARYDPSKPSIMSNVAVFGAVQASWHPGGSIENCYFENPWLEAAARPRWMPQWLFSRLLRITTRAATAPAISVPVTAFGAVTDGATDDSDAINDALRAAQAMRAGTVQIPPGTTAISRPIDLDDA